MALLALLIVAGFACSRRDAEERAERQPHTPSAPAASQAPPQDATPEPPGAAAHELALSFETGASLAQTQASLEEAVARGAVTLERATTEQRTLRGADLIVTEQALGVPGRSAVEHVRLVYFDGTLVSVVQTWRAPRHALAEALTAELGPALEADGWLGWWDPQTDRIVQLRDEGRVHETFDLAAAQPAVPEIRMVMLESWVARYGAPPPWAASPRAASPP